MISWLLTLNETLLFLLIFAGTAGFLMLCSFMVDRCLSTPEKDSDAVIGFAAQSMVIYAILLGFVIFTAINNFEKANAAIENEARTVSSISFNASLLPPVLVKKVNVILKDYLDNSIHKEWPAMRTGKAEDFATPQLNQLEALIRSYQPKTAAQVNTYDDLFQAINSLHLSHETRLDFAMNLNSKDEVWATVIITTLVMLFTNAFFYQHRRRTYYVYQLFIAITTSALLFLLINLDMPYQGQYSVSPKALEIVLDCMKAENTVS